MFDDQSILVGLELGTTKICAVVGQVGAGGALNIIGVGQARSRGVRKAEIVDAGAVAEDIREAIAEAEQMADVEIRSVYLGVTGGHIGSFNNRGRHVIASADRLIAEEDTQDAVKNAKAFTIPNDRLVIHMIRQHFRVDGRDSIANPIGMSGAQLEVDEHVVHGLTHRLQSSIQTVRGLQLEVEDIVFTGMASALAILTPEEKRLGTLVIDLGAGATEYVVYAEDVVKHTGVLAVGGDHVTQDLACGLNQPLGRAEQLKLDHGTAILETEARGRTATLSAENGLPERTVNLEHLRRIMSLRLSETLGIIAEELHTAGALDAVRGGVLLCGGGARVPGIDKLATRIFGLPAAMGRMRSISGLASALDQPEFATGIGLVKYGCFQKDPRRKRTSLSSRLKSTFSQMFQRA